MSGPTPHTYDPELIAYGGAFDPPHAGHLETIRLALKRFPQASLYVLPAAQPASAGNGSKLVCEDFSHRLAMALNVFEAEAPTRVKVLPLESELPRPNFTLNTLKRLATYYPGRRLGFIMGQDQLRSFPQWHEPLAILNLADLIIVSRGQDQHAPPLDQAVEDMALQLNLHLAWAQKKARADIATTGTAIHLLQGKVSAASSTQLRSDLAAGRTPPQGWLPTAVLDYIQKHQHYRKKKD